MTIQKKYPESKEPRQDVGLRKKAACVIKQVDAGQITPNQAREKLGLKKIDDPIGDMFIVRRVECDSHTSDD
ncbi:hypothetical protein ABWW58_02370 [Sporolactobacillus sp. STCC-11]|uniref:hypothetical protein n=1 Tax=Sporolactobacillus caesalpiniae TaxID=3230362 RepID=UPI0033938DC3